MTMWLLLRHPRRESKQLYRGDLLHALSWMILIILLLGS